MVKKIPYAQVLGITLVSGVALAVAGCAQKQVHASVPAYSVPGSVDAGRPMNTAPDTDAAPPQEYSPVAPVIAPDRGSQPGVAAALPSKNLSPAPPRPAVGQPPAEVAAEPASRPLPPQISPQLSVSDQASYQRKMNEDTAIAEKNLQDANGRQLNAGQQDLIEKIRSFLMQSRDASKSGDWARAQNLSQKARLLSIELANSF
jgi:hypothetical protein